MALSVKQTHDGSFTLYNSELDEHYHSIHGALTESLHVFINNGLLPACDFFENEDLHILEVGLGTGLNAGLTSIKSAQENKRIHYVATEPFPVDEKVLHTLKYNELPVISETPYWLNIHCADWEKDAQIHPCFTVHKTIAGIMDFVSENAHFHLIYFDAFAPEKQSDMWEPQVLQKCYDLLVPNGILVSYCAKGQFKRNLKSCGFSVEAKQGPPGKREMVFARK